MDIQQMVEEGTPIFVINRSATVLGNSHLIMLEFPHPTGGRKSTVMLPPVKYPINLTQRVAPPSAIAMCQDFIELVNRGVLQLVSPDKARKILAEPGAQASVNRAYQKLQERRRPTIKKGNSPNSPFKVRDNGGRITDAVADLGTSDLTGADFSRGYPGESYDEEAEPAVETVTKSAETLRVAGESSNTSPKVVQFCIDLVENPELKKDYLMELKSWDEEALTSEDLGYMVDQLREFDTIVAYLRSVMAQRAGDRVREEEADDIVETAPSTKRRKKSGKRRRKPSPLTDLDD